MLAVGGTLASVATAVVANAYYDRVKDQLGNSTSKGIGLTVSVLFAWIVLRYSQKHQQASSELASWSEYDATTRDVTARESYMQLDRLKPTDLELVDIRLSPRLDLVARFDGQRHSLPPAGALSDIMYELADGRLLIIGEPGSGKSILLYDLIKKAHQHSKCPILINLSSWAPTEEQSFGHFVVLHLSDAAGAYKIPAAIAESALAQDTFEYFIDGLDEVFPAFRGAALNSITTFARSRASCRIVLTCRTKDYYELSKGARIGFDAVEVCDLDDGQLRLVATRASHISKKTSRPRLSA